MIQPVNALTPKVLFRGGTTFADREAAKKDTRKKIALINAGGVSLTLGAVATAIARSSTSSWRHAGIYGALIAAVSMMFVGPAFLYKSGINTTKNNEADKLMKDVDPSKKLKDGKPFVRKLRTAA